MKDVRNSIRHFVTSNIVVIFFTVICLSGYFMAGLPFGFFLNDIISRLGRNTFMVLALIIPVLAGMGLNFAIVLGAMGGQFGIIMVTHWGIPGFQGILLAMALSFPINMLLGYLTGRLLNRTKGKEMITGLILGFFAMGVYQLILLVFIGTIIPMQNEAMVLSSGIGLRTTVDIGTLKYGLDGVIRMPLPIFVILTGIFLAAFFTIRYRRKKQNPLLSGTLRGNMTYAIVGVLAVLWGISIYFSAGITKNLNVPMMTFFFIFLLCLFTVFLQNTKIGQDFRTVGQSMHIATVSGIPVNQVRLKAIMISTILAGWGQIIFLQNLGIFSVYGAHEQVGLFAVASILIGGASITKAGISNAILGTLLFHTLFIISPLAAQNLFGNAQVGEYFRVFISYGVIGLALAMYAWQKIAMRAKH